MRMRPVAEPVNWITVTSSPSVLTFTLKVGFGAGGVGGSGAGGCGTGGSGAGGCGAGAGSNASGSSTPGGTITVGGITSVVSAGGTKSVGIGVLAGGTHPAGG